LGFLGELIVKIENNKKVWFTSDSHACHRNIIKYSNRPFKCVDEMNTQLVKNWNELVNPGDLTFHLGDFCFGDLSQWENFRNQLNGDIILIKGNHDKLQNGQIKHLFQGIHNFLEIDVKDEDAPNGWQHITLCHYALRVWNRSHYGAYSLFGHSHGTLQDDPNSLSFDVGVDCHNYKPISYNRVKEIMATKTFRPIDHHGN
jgi:calcineurin-like phosphoesterase family protein